MTATQALENAKGMTFEAFWAGLMEDREQQAEDREQLRLLRESQDRTDAQISRMSAKVDSVSQQMGILNNDIGKLIEEVFSAQVWEKFNAFGYEFHKGSERYKLRGEGNQILAEIDVFLENGDYAMAVEVKTKLTQYWVDDHLERIEIVRRFMDEHGDKRKIVGAVAGGIVPENVKRYAEKQGLYVLVRSGDAVKIAEEPDTFACKVWG
jgi:hypothetical protein